MIECKNCFEPNKERSNYCKKCGSLIIVEKKEKKETVFTRALKLTKEFINFVLHPGTFLRAISAWFLSLILISFFMFFLFLIFLIIDFVLFKEAKVVYLILAIFSVLLMAAIFLLPLYYIYRYIKTRR